MKSVTDMRKLVLPLFLCLIFTFIFGVFINFFQKDARAINTNDCPTFSTFVPREGTDALDKPLKAYFSASKNPIYAPLSFFVVITNELIDKPPSAGGAVFLKEETPVGPAGWVADLGDIPAGTYFLYLYYNKTGTIADAEECAHFRFWLQRNGSFGDSGDGATGEEGKPTACSVDGKEGIETALGCIPTDVSGFVERLLSIFLGVAGGIAFLMMIFGAFKIIGSSGDPDALQEGRSIITAAITGLLLILFSVFILNLIGIKILQLPIPGIGFIPPSSVAYAQFAGVPDPTKYGGKDLGQVVSDLLPFVFSLAAIVTFLYLLYGGFKYLTASGDPKAVDSARKVITSAITGLIIIFLAFTIITVLGRVLGLPFVFISPVYAQGVDIGESFGIPSDLRELGGFGGFLSQKVLPLVFGLAGIIFFFYLLFGGIKFLTASGDPKAVDSAKRSLTTAFIGLLIIFLSFWIMVVIGNLIGFQVF